MTSLFVSHSSADNAAAMSVLDQLRDRGVEAVFVDYDPEGGIPVGHDWERELYRQVRRCDAVVFLSSPDAAASRWCFTEVALARLLDKPVFPVVVRDGPRHPLLRDVQHLDLTREPSLDRLLAGLRLAGLDPNASFAFDPDRPPYPGLRAFTEEDAAVFFGRESEIERLMELMRPGLRHRGRFIAVVGPSGSGKSSLVSAGLLPRLHQAETAWLVLPTLVPGDRPIRRLARNIASALAAHGVDAHVAELATRLSGSGSALTDAVEELRDTYAGPPPHVLMVIDQAEELVTLSPSDERRRLLDLVRQTIDDALDLWAIASVRAEFLDVLLQQPDTGGLIDDALLVTPLDRGRLFAVIEGPAKLAGLEFAPGLVNRFVDETEGGDALPLLAFTLRRLVDLAGRDGKITTAAYESTGGVLGALRAQADTTAARFDSQHGRLVIPTLTRLATVTPDGQPGRRRVLRATLTDREDQIIQAFIDDRLLVSGTDEQGRPIVEVAHEALLRQWPPLRASIDERRSDIYLRAELERWAGDWVHAGRRESYLVGGDRLAAILRWRDSHADELSRLDDSVTEFIDASSALQAQRDQARQDAERQRQLAHTRGFIQRLRGDAEQATSMLTLEPARALASAVAVVGANAAELGGEPLAFVQSSLFTTVRAAKERRTLSGHDETVTAVALSPDGRWLVTGACDRTARIWSLEGDGIPIILDGHRGDVLAVAVSPDGDLIATGSEDCTVRLWRSDGTPLGGQLIGPTDAVLCLAFSPESRAVVAGAADCSVHHWLLDGRMVNRVMFSSYISAVAFSGEGVLAVAGGDGLVAWLPPTALPRDGNSAGGWLRSGFRDLTGHNDFVTAVAFDPSGQTLASTSGDGTLRIWRGDDTTPVTSSTMPYRTLVTSVTFVAGGSAMFIGGEDGTTRLLDIAGEEIHSPLPCAGHAVAAVAGSSDGRLLVGGAGNLIHVWDWLPRDLPAPTIAGRRPSVSTWDRNGDQAAPAWPAHDFVAAVAFTADGQHIVSVGGDRAIRVWNLDGSVRTELRDAHDGGITAVACPPGGEQIFASGGRDTVVRLYDLDGEPVTDPLVGHTSDVTAVAFAPNGQLLASAGRDGTIRLWEPDGRPLGRPFRHSDGEALGVAFSADSERLVSCGSDRTVRLWRLDGGLDSEPFVGHTRRVWDVAFDPTGEIIVSCADDRTVRLWTVGGTPIGQPLRAHTGPVRAARFHPSGRLLVTGGEDGTVRLWIFEGGQLARPLEGHRGAVFAVAVRPDGEYAATGGQDGTVRLWRLGHHRSWLAEACDRLSRHPLLDDPDDDTARAALRVCRDAGLSDRTRRP